MRLEFLPSREQRAALRAQCERLELPAEVLRVFGPLLPTDAPITGMASRVQSVHPDRFVLRARVHTRSEGWREYALKAYADEFGARVWAFARELADCRGIPSGGVCLPIRHVPAEHLLVFPWVDGECLADIVDERAGALMRRAAVLAARLHREAIAPEPRTAPAELVAHVQARYERLERHWPEAAPVMKPLVSALEEAVGSLDPATPATVHGDLWAGQFVWTGERLVLLDLDAFGYTDPAYDVGHFLAQLERGNLLDPRCAARAEGWAAAFLDAYRAAMPEVSSKNIAFYRALTLVRKIYTARRVEVTRWPRLATALARRAQEALAEMTDPAIMSVR